MTKQEYKKKRVHLLNKIQAYRQKYQSSFGTPYHIEIGEKLGKYEAELFQLEQEYKNDYTINRSREIQFNIPVDEDCGETEAF